MSATRLSTIPFNAAIGIPQSVFIKFHLQAANERPIVAEVDPHYFDHVVKLSETTDVEASQDIFSGNGVKLLVKGNKIDAKARERLLEFRLTMPLENIMQVVGGTQTSHFSGIAESLLAKHGLLRGICATVPGYRGPSVVGDVAISSNLLSLLRVYASQPDGKLQHDVGVALLSAAMGGSLSANPRT